MNYQAFRIKLAAIADQPFRFGHHDCVWFVSELMKAATGRDLNPFKYVDRRDAVRVLRRHGGFETALTKALGTPIASSTLRDFDIVMIKTKEASLIGVFFCGWILVKGPRHVVQVSGDLAYKVWRWRA